MHPYLKIIRLPNLLIMVVTQYMIRFCIIRTFYALGDARPAFGELDFFLLVISTVLIAAGGYVINDYYDIEADRVNKSKKVLIGKSIAVKTVTQRILDINNTWRNHWVLPFL